MIQMYEKLYVYAYKLILNFSMYKKYTQCGE